MKKYQGTKRGGKGKRMVRKSFAGRFLNGALRHKVETT
uniref:Uncharacterized protein n=1 Tax=viral metagenome TaxID=1070528 RepID=A0A6C0L7Z4_9ZZZZ